MNQIIKNLTIQNYKIFKDSFNDSRKIFWDDKSNQLIHPGEYGEYREELAKKWLRMYVPGKFGIGSGFIISPKGSISTQCDIIIYDKTTTPVIESIDNQKFFPIETIACIGEIKSNINSNKELNSHLEKLSVIKKLRDEAINPTPYFKGHTSLAYDTVTNPFDNFYSFIICKKLNFDLSSLQIIYDKTEQRHKHNVVLSLDDGILFYKTSGGTNNCPWPIFLDKICIDYFVANDHIELPTPVIHFLSSLQTALTFNALLNIDMVHYLTDNQTNNIV